MNLFPIAVLTGPGIHFRQILQLIMCYASMGID